MCNAMLKMAEGYALLAEGMRELAEAGEAPVKPEKKAKKAVSEKAEAPASTEETASAEETVTVERVRAVLADKSREGKTQEVRKLLNEFGAEKLSAIPAEKLSDLLKKAEVL